MQYITLYYVSRTRNIGFTMQNRMFLMRETYGSAPKNIKYNQVFSLISNYILQLMIKTYISSSLLQLFLKKYHCILE